MDAASQTNLARRLIILAAGIAALVVLASKLQTYWRRARMARQHGCKPVMGCASRDPFLGLDMLRRLLREAASHKTLEGSTWRLEAHGNTFRSQQLLNRVIVTAEPENIKTLLALRFDDYGVGHRIEQFGPLLGAGIFDTDGPHWHASRALIRPSFSRNQVADLAALERLIPDLLALVPHDGETTVDLQDLFFRYTLDSATEFLFGTSVGCLREPEPRLPRGPDDEGSDVGFAEAFNYALDAIRMRGLLGPLHVFRRDTKAERCNRICRDFAEQFVDRAVEAVREADDHGQRCGAKYVFSHELARRTTDRVRILDELMNVLLAGRDTTASMLSNMFFMLAKSPRVWARLQEEVAFLEGRPPTYEELRGLKYLKCCMNESLRLHPVVPVNARKALRDTVLPLGGGADRKSPVFVPSGTRVVYSIYAMHRRKDFYGPDADEFRPERWESGKLLPRWEFLPFNGGPRVCLGQQYALTEVSYVTVRIAQTFSELESRDPGPWEEKLTLTMCSRNGTKVCLKPVKS